MDLNLATRAIEVKKDKLSTLTYSTLVEMSVRACLRFADRPFLGFRPSKSAPYQWVTYGQFGQMVSEARALLKDARVSHGDKVAIISRNRTEWAVFAYASFSLGAVYVPMYEQQQPREWEYILKDSTAKLLLVSTEVILNKTRPFLSSIPSLQDIWCLDADVPARLSAVTPTMMGGSKPAHVTPEDVATLIYTSGTTGLAKGVALTHRNICLNIQGMNEVLPSHTLPVTRSLSFLPWAHCIGKNCELHNLLQRGGQIALTQDSSTLADDLKEIKPTILFAVPQFYKRLYDQIQEHVAAKGYLSRCLFWLAMSVAERRREALAAGHVPSYPLRVQHQLLSRLVLHKLRELLGGQLVLSPVGGSAMCESVVNFFENLQVAILEGYGLTETSPLLTLSSIEIGKRRPGTVGKPIPGVKLAIVKESAEVEDGEEGEIWATGPTVFKGYHRKAEETREAFVELGGRRWFRTGDLGILKDGVLKITGRVKDLYKLDNGKYVAPAVVEKALSDNDYVMQAVVVGANRPHNVALLVVNWRKLAAWALLNQVPHLSEPPSLAQLKASTEVQAFVSEQVAVACSGGKVKRYEVPQALVLLEESFSVENGMLTPKQSIRRAAVAKVYQSQIEEVYAQSRRLAAIHKSRVKEGELAKSFAEDSEGSEPLLQI